MWRELPANKKVEYQRMILAFASLTEMFEQKKEDKESFVPVVNSKYQEKVFQKAFDATAEDIGNTSYDASIGGTKKYLVGLKTFNLKSGFQKIAQFKANHDEWAEDMDQISKNARNSDGSLKRVDEINKDNADLYLRIARRLGELRNKRIKASIKNLQGFFVSENDDIESVYHVLMPTCSNGDTSISVGEISYDYIDIGNIKIKGCSNANNPTNFTFSDGNHEYRFTSADSQLLMNFNNNKIILEKWPVTYVDDAYKIFSDLSARASQYQELKEESYCWLLTNKEGEVEQFSGFNSFYGVGSKIGTDKREAYIDKFSHTYSSLLGDKAIIFRQKLTYFLMTSSSRKEEKMKKVEVRKELLDMAAGFGNENLMKSLEPLLFRPSDELYIPIPNARRFHAEHPTFFVKNGIEFNNASLAQSKEDRSFKLIFEPSHNAIDVYIAEDTGKAIESTTSMSVLGKWILRDVFQLDKYEPLTAKKLNEVGINALRLIKYENSDEIHLHFIWVDEDNKPGDFWE